MTSSQAPLTDMKQMCAAYAAHLQAHHDTIAKVMTAYQSYATTADEIERSVECLTSLPEIQQHLTHTTDRVCTFFPLNLPVYSLVLFAIIPSLIARDVYLRPPQKMIPVFKALLPALGLAKHFPNIHVSFDSREDFIKNYVADADVTIFTGKESNARKVLEQTRKDSLFLFNGWGCNPIVVSDDADLDVAVAKAVEAKLFNSGQDCAGPDNILVHSSLSERFLTQLQEQISRAKVSEYTDPTVTVGRIAEESALVRLASFLLKHQSETVHGGCIDFPRSIVYPTVVTAPLAVQTNYEEFFSPIFYVNTYDDDQELAQYFDDPRYAANNMYISLFGSSAYVEGLPSTILYRNQTILDVERGNNAYGGYSFGASFVATGGKIEARPILVPREMSSFLEAKAKAAAAPQKVSAGQHKRIQQRVAQAMKDHFGDNLVFGFVFGSVAKGRATTRSDIDTMAVTQGKNEQQISSYLTWLADFHAEMKMNVDLAYPAEIVMLAELEQAISSLDSITLGLRSISEQDFDAVVWTDVLTGVKRGIMGNESLLFGLAKQIGKYPKLWKEQILHNVEKRLNPEHDEDDRKDLARLRRMEPDAVVKRFVGLEYYPREQREAIEKSCCRSICLGSKGTWEPTPVVGKVE